MSDELIASLAYIGFGTKAEGTVIAWAEKFRGYDGD